MEEDGSHGRAAVIFVAAGHNRQCHERSHRRKSATARRRLKHGSPTNHSRDGSGLGNRPTSFRLSSHLRRRVVEHRSDGAGPVDLITAVSGEVELAVDDTLLPRC